MKKTKKSNLTTLAILTTLTILTWVFIEAYSRFNKVEVTSIPENILSPISPSFDQETLADIANKKYYTDEEINKFTTSKQTAKPEATQSAQASGSGQQ